MKRKKVKFHVFGAIVRLMEGPFKLLVFLTFIISEIRKLSFCAKYVFMEKQYWIFLHTFDLWKHVAVHIDKS